MDIRDSQRIKQICDNIEKMADAFTRIADVLERLTEPNCSEKPNNSQTCANCKFDHEEWFEEACDSCCDAHSNWQPKTEPQTEDPPMDEYYKDHDEFYEPQTDCAWGKGEE